MVFKYEYNLKDLYTFVYFFLSLNKIIFLNKYSLFKIFFNVYFLYIKHTF